MFFRKYLLLIIGGPLLIALAIGFAAAVKWTPVTNNNPPHTDSSVASIQEVPTSSASVSSTIGPTPADLLMTPVVPKPTSSAATSSKKIITIPVTKVTVRAPITVRLADQNKLFNETVAIVCVNPFNGVTGGNIYTGTGVIVNASRYI